MEEKNPAASAVQPRIILYSSPLPSFLCLASRDGICFINPAWWFVVVWRRCRRFVFPSRFVVTHHALTDYLLFSTQLFSEWDAIIKYDDIVFEKALKSGNYGKVWKGKVRGQIVAVKVLSNQDLTTKKLEELQREVDIMRYASSSLPSAEMISALINQTFRRLHHPRIMLLMGICTEPKKISLIMEFVEGR